MSQLRLLFPDEPISSEPGGHARKRAPARTSPTQHAFVEGTPPEHVWDTAMSAEDAFGYMYPDLEPHPLDYVMRIPDEVLTINVKWTPRHDSRGRPSASLMVPDRNIPASLYPLLMGGPVEDEVGFEFIGWCYDYELGPPYGRQIACRTRWIRDLRPAKEFDSLYASMERRD